MMISAEYGALSWFLWIAGIAFFLGSALPLFICPLRWGRAFGWEIPEESQFCVYLGRCLGGVAIALSILVFRAAPEPEQFLHVLEALLLSAVFLTMVHIWGAIHKVQPWKESLELVMYIGIVVYGSYLYCQMGNL